MAQAIRGVSKRGKQNITTNAVEFDDIVAKTILFDKIKGGTATFGGADNGNGEIIVKDENGDTKVTVDKDGILIENANFKAIEDELEISVMNFENLIPDHSFETIAADYVTGPDATYYDYGIDSSIDWGIIGSPRLISIKNSEFPLTIAPTKYGYQSIAANSTDYVTKTIILNPSTTYFISAYFCNGNRTAGSPIMTIETIDVDLNVTSTINHIFTSNSGQFNWKRDGFQFTTGEDDIGITIYLKSNGSGYAVWDSVQLIKNDIACVYDPETTAFNIDTSGGAGAVESVNGQTGVVVLTLPTNTAATTNQFITAYNSTTGGFTKAQPTWANIDKSTSNIADIATKSHTSLTDIGTNTHAQIDTALSRLANTSGTNTGDNAVNSLYSGLATSKQDTLVSGTNIKTINSTSLLGSGNISLQAPLVADTDYLTPSTASSTYEPKKGADDNYVTDAEKIVLGNTSGTNTGDQDLSGYALKSNVLEKDNTTAYTPTTDYHPATKKFVEDSITEAGGHTYEQIYDLVGTMVTGNTETGITVTYDDATDKLNFEVASQTDNNFTDAYKNAVDANTAKVTNATHTGDVTGATTLTIANDAVTYAKMQNVSATDKVLGRASAGSGDVEEITCTAAGRALLDDADAEAQRTTLGLGESALNDNSGWINFPIQPAYERADSPTFVMIFDSSVDIMSILGVGDRIKLTQTTIKYFIVTGIADVFGATEVTMYGGTDYTLTNAEITNAMYSHAKYPFGFPSDPLKWSVVVTNTTEYTQNSPTAGTWYNLGSINISVPIGKWDISYELAMEQNRASADYITMFPTLSTTSSSASDGNWRSVLQVKPMTNYTVPFYKIRKGMLFTSKTTYYLNIMTDQSGTTNIRIRGSLLTTKIVAECCYL
jgi:hypothetical protein